MSDPVSHAVMVIARPDGTVPMAADLHPHVRAEIIKHLNAAGHTLTHHPDGTIQIQDYNPTERPLVRHEPHQG